MPMALCRCWPPGHEIRSPGPPAYLRAAPGPVLSANRNAAVRGNDPPPPWVSTQSGPGLAVSLPAVTPAPGTGLRLPCWPPAIESDHGPSAHLKAAPGPSNDLDNLIEKVSPLAILPLWG